VSNLDDLGQLSEEEWNLLQDRADQLEQTLEKEDQVDLRPLLPPAGTPARLIYLVELIKTELEILYRRKQGRPLEHYLDHYPELGGAAALPAGIIYEEYRVRQLFGDRPELDFYQRRFPGQYPALQRLLKEQPVKPPPAPPRRDPPNPLLTPTVFNPTPSDRPGPTAVPGAAPADDQRPLLPVGGGYKLLQLLGRIEFGEIYRAQAPGGVEAAVKLIYRSLDPHASQHELKALEKIRQLHHPFLLLTQAYWALEDRLVIVTELADASLEERFAECKRLGMAGIPVDELVTYLGQAAEALDYLHGKQVRHGNLKPRNLLLLQGYAKVADFGLARAPDRAASVYAAPEALQDRAGVSSDQYSLAAIYAEMRLGRHILPGCADLDGLGAAESQVVLRALSKDPEKRFSSCRAFARALAEAVAPAATPRRQPAAWLIAVVVAGLLGALGLLGLLAWFLTMAGLRP